MSIAAFLPLGSAEYVRERLAVPIRFASSWDELAGWVSRQLEDVVIVDPSADGEMNIGAVARIQDSCPTTLVVAYVALSHENLKAVFYLSGRGLREVFVHPPADGGKRLAEFVRRQSGHRLSAEFLSLLEARIERLDPRLLTAVKDLFERPHRYDSAADIAMESGMSTKCVYSSFQKGGICTPWKLLTAARVLRGYADMTRRPEPIGTISRDVGYKRCRTFSQQVINIFGCSPSSLRADANTSKVVLQLAEWVYKPVPRHTHRARHFQR